MTALDQFGPLDELIQVIYQGTSRFVILSNVGDETWSIHVGLVDDRKSGWWRTGWSNYDILRFAGSRSSEDELQALADKIAEAFVQGDLTIEDWSVLKDERDGLNLVIGPKSKKPLRMSLSELTLQEAATYTAGAFCSIALQAQKRKCHLNPTALSASLPSPPRRGRRSSLQERERPPSRNAAQSAAAPTTSTAHHETTTVATKEKSKERDEIESLKAQLAEAKAHTVEGPSSNKIEDAASVAAPASKPRKKARKYQAMEFASDED